MICEKCGRDNSDKCKFCTGCGVSLTAPQTENGESQTAWTTGTAQASYSGPVSDERQTVAIPRFDPTDETMRVPSFGPNYAVAKRNSSKFLLIGGIILALLLLPVVGAIVWWQMQKSDGQPAATEQDTPGRTSSGLIADPDSQSNSSNRNRSPESSADDEFSMIQTKFAGGEAGLGSSALGREVKDAETKYPDDYRFIYQEAKIEAVRSKSQHHETFELLFAAGEKAVKAGKSAEFLSDLQKDKDMDFKRLNDHKEWLVLENALLRNDSKTLKVTEHHK